MKTEYDAIIFRNVDDFGIMVEIDHNKKEVNYYVRDYKYSIHDYWLYIYGTNAKEDFEEFTQYMYKREMTEFIVETLDYAVSEFNVINERELY